MAAVRNGVIENIDEGALDDLLTRTEAPISARRIWWEAWTDAFAEEPWLLTLHGPDAGLSACAPLVRRRRARGRTEVVLLGHGTSSTSRRCPKRR